MMQPTFRAVLLGSLIALMSACNAETDAGKAAAPADATKPAVTAETAVKVADVVKVENP